MKIAFITDLYPNISIGGGSSYSFFLTKELSKTEDVTVLIPKINPEKLENLKTNVNYKLIETKNVDLIRSIIFMKNVSEKVKNSDFDIIHSNAGAGAFIKTKKPFIETFHHWPKELIPALHGIPMRMCLKKADKIIAVSNNSKNEILSRYKNYESKIKVLGSAVNYNFFKKIKNEIKSQLKNDLGINNEKIILNVNSEVSYRKNLPLMLDTINFLINKNVNLKLIIIAPESFREKIIKSAKEKKVVNFIKYVPMKISYEMMPYYYSIADFLAVPSIQEGFGLPYLEAITLNIPFVSLNTGIAPILEKQGFGFISFSYNDFMNKCLEMLKEPISFRNGKNFIKKHYSWSVRSKEVLNIYSTFIK